MSMDTYQPFFAAYAASRGSTPEQMERGTKTNLDYMTWIKQRWAEFKGVRPELFDANGATPAAQAPFEAWLTARFKVRV